MKKNIFLVAILLFTTQSCTSPRTVVGLLGIATDLVSLLNECHTLSEKFNTKVVDLSGITQKEINNGNKSVVDLAKFWEKFWVEIVSDYKDLVAKVNEVNINSDIYFKELDINNSTIKKEELRQQDAKKNKELWDSYEIEYANAIESLNNAEKLLNQGNDMMAILRNMVLREHLKENISTLQSLSKKSEILSLNITAFSENCTELFKGNIKH